MGTWGTGLYANDCARDVRDIYTECLQNQLSNEEAYKETLKKCKDYLREEEEPLFWYALADTQWRLGRLRLDVKEKALYWIERLGGIEEWKDSKNGGAGWKKTLQKLKDKLESPMPAEKRIRKPVKFVENPWNVGDVYVYKFVSECAKEVGLYGKFIPLQKIGDVEWMGMVCTQVQIYDRIFDDVPTLQDLEGVRILPNRPAPGDKDLPLELSAIMKRYKKKFYQDEAFTFVGNDVSNIDNPCVVQNWNGGCFWNYDLEDCLCTFYPGWQGREYVIKGDNAYWV